MQRGHPVMDGAWCDPTAPEFEVAVPGASEWHDRGDYYGFIIWPGMAQTPEVASVPDDPTGRQLCEETQPGTPAEKPMLQWRGTAAWIL